MGSDFSALSHRALLGLDGNRLAAQAGFQPDNQIAVEGLSAESRLVCFALLR
jgi:hypothetical protein